MPPFAFAGIPGAARCSGAAPGRRATTSRSGSATDSGSSSHLSSSSISSFVSAPRTRQLTNEWETEYRAFQQRSLADRD